eukprot:1156210-Pelagomonas_calceolata.AAC.1
MTIEKGPECDYVSLVQHEGTDGVKQRKNNCLALAAEDTWVNVDENEEGEEEGAGGQQEEGSSSDGEGWFTDEEEDVEEDFEG